MASPDTFINPINQSLTAVPGMADSMLSDTIMYMCKHNERDALGLVINRPTDIGLAALLGRIDLKLEIRPLARQSVYYGGPVQTECGFVLHDATGAYSSSLAVPSGLEMTTSKDMLEAVAQGGGPHRFILTLGYTDWSIGRPEGETSRNDWLTVQADPETVFNAPPEVRPTVTLNSFGINSATLSGEAGHA